MKYFENWHSESQNGILSQEDFHYPWIRGTLKTGEKNVRYSITITLAYSSWGFEGGGDYLQFLSNIHNQSFDKFISWYQFYEMNVKHDMGLYDTRK